MVVWPNLRIKAPSGSLADGGSPAFRIWSEVGRLNRESDLLRENQALRERLSRLSEASLRVSESLDFDTVLQGVLDSACALTQARYGVVTLLDESGQLHNVLQSGFTSEEFGLLRTVGGEGWQLLNYFRSFDRPQRHPDLLGHLRSKGLPQLLLPGSANTAVSFLGSSLLHHGERVGNFFLAGKEGGDEFTKEDEETLVMFASQAAMVIANARRYRDERRARTDLETLVDTSPVGVAVFDARTGAPVSFNREMERIIAGLRTPDQPPEHLLEIMTVKRADGREISLEELSLAQVLSIGETVRAEEVILCVPDGRSITTLMNATSIRSEEGTVDTVVVTLQDMTPLEDLERLRAEFLAMVSHELRTPLATVRGSVSTLLDEFSSLHPSEIRQFHRIIFEQTDRMRALIADLLDVARIETGTLPVSPEPTDLAALAGEAANAFRISGHKHYLSVDTPQDLTWVMADKARIIQVLGNLLNNAARHSSESTTIRMSAATGEFQVSVSVSDEGEGIPIESLPHLFRKFSRIETEEHGGGTGLGLAVCRGIVEAHGGRIWAESAGRGLGARFTFTIPTAEESGFFPPARPPELSTRPSRRSAQEQVRILALDDDDQALRYIRDSLVSAGYTVFATGEVEHALRLMEEEKPHLVILDLMLPGANGIELMKDIVDVDDVPVIFVSAYGQDHLIAQAFEVGADDYVVKPFSPTELVARIKAALRRRTTAEPSAPYILGDLTIDYGERLVTLGGRPVGLTGIQYRMIVELSANAGRVLTYAHLLRRVWDSDNEADVRPIRTAMSAIRRKLGDDADNPTYIFTELGVGYKMPRRDG